jgi:hypothetical protein
MLALALTVLAFAVIGVLAHSWMKAFAAIGDTRHALANCEDSVTVTVRIVDHLSPRLRIVSSNAFRPLPQPVLRAAA